VFKKEFDLPLTRLWWMAYKASHLLGQACYPYKSLAAIRQDQTRRVRAAVAHAHQHVPYYRETMTRLGLTPTDFQTAADLKKFPLLERRQIQRDPEYFVTGGRARESWFKCRTGGSTGAPVTVYHDTAALMRIAAYSHREGPVVRAILGRSQGLRHTMIVNIPGLITNLHTYIDQHSFSPRGRGIPRQILSVKDPLDQNLRRLNEFQPDILRSFGSYLGHLFSYLESHGASFHRPQLITYVADRLPESVRRLINDKYGVPVISDYGAIEALKIGFECEAHLGYHLNLDLYPLRLIDAEGQEVSRGETGEVVVSDLVNRGTVILNYRLGDLAALLPDTCPCGRTLPLLSFLEGRIYDFIRSPSGEKVHPMVVGNFFRFEEGIYQYQVVQRALDHMEVRLVPKENCHREETQKRVTEAFAHYFGPDLRVEVVFVPDVERTRAGKVRQVLSLLPEATDHDPAR
jgi:phenylacetate-coenzyme A ligase PaaK-like adenylate-forming protein